MNHGPSENSGPEDSGFSDTDIPSGAPDTEDAGLESAGSELTGSAGRGADALGAHVFGIDGSGTQRLGLDTLGSDELALRRLMHQVVEEIEPTDGTLDHLRRAVPARRARKRQAVVGVAAAALFIGTAVPALLHVSNATGPNADPSIAANSSQTQGSSEGKGETDAGSGSGSSSGKAKDKNKDDKKEESGKGKGASGESTGAQPSASAANVPACTSTQLGSSGGSVGSPDAVGAVYGTFRITNVSTAGCAVTGAGSISPSGVGAADPAKLGTAVHAAGDAAAGLPDPATYNASLVLQPGAAYEVQFAWVPSESCPTTGGTGGNGGNGDGEPSPDPTPTDDATTGASGGTSSEGTSGVSPQLMRADGVEEGSVVVSYTAEGGAPTASATVSNACAGTVYRTGLLAGA